MRKLCFIAAALALLTTACDQVPFLGGGGDERTILVDYSHDEFASAFFFNYPSKIAVTQGTRLIFRQTWTGEPHTVTAGSLVDETLGGASDWIAFFTGYEGMLKEGVDVPPPGEAPDTPFADILETIQASDIDEARDFLEAYERLVDGGSEMPPLDDPGDATFAEVDEIASKESDEAIGALPFAFSEEEEGGLAQNVSQPCYLREGGPPKKETAHCSDTQQQQPAEFDGSHSYYNSGIIPYEGPQGNTFEVQLADDIDPGKYWFYCAVHGPLQATQVDVKPVGSEVPSQAEVSQQARKEIDEVAQPLRDLHRQAVRRNRVEITTFAGQQDIRGPFGGLYDTSVSDHALINEFIPKRLEAKAGEPITWRLVGSDHTVTFGVPRYFPIVQFLEDGTVRLNPKIEPPAGGSAPPPEETDEPPDEEEEPTPTKVDGGTYDGTGFWSSGLIGGEPYAEYTMRISKPGTYDFACLIHPPMVGKIEVT
jgi:plastocyanin